MAEQVSDGFDHIQILMAYPYQFDVPAMSLFQGPSPIGEEWSMTFMSLSQTFAAASGPNPGNETIHFDIWVAGDRQADRPAFHFQTYRNGVRVDNADIICFGPGELDWMVAPGTCALDQPLTTCIPGDANFDGMVTDADYTIWADNYGHSPADCSLGSWNDDGITTDADYTIWADNYGYGVAAVSEPASLALLLPAAAWALRRRRRR
jgi:hypothetical protein